MKAAARGKIDTGNAELDIEDDANMAEEASEAQNKAVDDKAVRDKAMSDVGLVEQIMPQDHPGTSSISMEYPETSFGIHASRVPNNGITEAELKHSALKERKQCSQGETSLTPVS